MIHLCVKCSALVTQYGSLTCCACQREEQFSKKCRMTLDEINAARTEHPAPMPQYERD
jgi:hypothetical protein